MSVGSGRAISGESSSMSAIIVVEGAEMALRNGHCFFCDVGFFLQY